MKNAKCSPSCTPDSKYIYSLDYYVPSVLSGLEACTVEIITPKQFVTHSCSYGQHCGPY